MRGLHPEKLTAALATDAAALADYGLDAADATLLAKETADFEEIVANPVAAVVGRKALTQARPSELFRLVRIPTSVYPPRSQDIPCEIKSF